MTLRIGAEEAGVRDAALDAVHVAHWDNIGTELLTPTAEQLGEWGRRLVVGTRGYNPISGPLGSTGEYRVRDAHCAVLFTHATETQEPPTDGRITWPGKVR